MTEYSINILSKTVHLIKRPLEKLKGLNIGERLSFEFYDGLYRGVDMLFIKPKGANPTPRKCAITSERLIQIFNLPVVFILSPGPTYERQRLIDKDVFFIMSDKYAYLPMMVALEKVTTNKIPQKLTPVAQYILLYHLEIESVDGKSIKAIASLMPYSYESVSIGLTCLSDVGLCEKEAIDSRNKTIRFKSSGKALWEAAEEFLIDPVVKRIYCDEIDLDKEFPVCGINALSHYSMLNPDSERWLMMTVKEFREIMAENKIVNPNEFDGDLILEVWKYPVVRKKNSLSNWVDPLSLVLSLKKDQDPRVESEIEQVVKNIKW